jgi:hypothetical protein
MKEWKRRVGILSCLIFLGFISMPAVAAEQRHAGKHVHGEGELNIAVEGMTALIEFRAPGDSLYGFEHEAKTDAEKKKLQGALELLKSKIHEMVILDKSLGCKFTPKRVAVVEEGADHGTKTQEQKGSAGKPVEQKKSPEHREVVAEFSLACAKPLSGTTVRFGFTKAFPSLNELEVQALSGANQSGATIRKDKGSVKL